MDRRGHGRWLIVATACLLGGAIAFLWPSVVNSLLYFPSRGLDADPKAAGLAYEDVEMRTSDGERLHGWWIPAARPPATAHVLFFHGNGGNIAHRIAHARVLADAGLDVLLFDYRGYGRSTGSPNESGTYADARAAREAVVARPGVDPAALVYLGESLGGAVATELAVAHPPAALVLQSTFTSVRAMARLHYPVVPAAFVPDAYPTRDRLARAARARPRPARGSRHDHPAVGGTGPFRRRVRAEAVGDDPRRGPQRPPARGRARIRRDGRRVGARGPAIAASVSPLLDSTLFGGRG